MTGSTHSKHRIGVVNSSTFGIHFPHVIERLQERGSVDRITVSPDLSGAELARELRGYEFLIASVTPTFSAEFFRRQSELLLIARHGIGCDNVDLDAATEHGVLVTRVEGAHERDAVAELNVSLILDALRLIKPAQQAVQNRSWERRRDFVGRELNCLTTGVVGYGNIGSRVAEIVSQGFGGEVLICDPEQNEKDLRSTPFETVGLSELLERSDLISLNASLNPGSRGMLGPREFEQMKDGVVLVNTARGELIDESALVDALDSGKVGAAGLDVVSREPIPDDHPLLDRENVTIVPHIGGYTRHSLREMDEKNVRDVESVIDGQLPRQVANPDVLTRSNRAGIRP